MHVNKSKEKRIVRLRLSSAAEMTFIPTYISNRIRQEKGYPVQIRTWLT